MIASLKSFVAANKGTLMYLTIVVVVILIFTAMWKKGVFRNIFQEGVTEDPNLTDVENAKVRALAVSLYNDMDGLPYNRNMSAWREFMGLNGRMQQAVYDVFGQMYYDAGKGTFTDWVQDEWEWEDAQGIASQRQVLARLAELNLAKSDGSLDIVRSERMPLPQLQFTLR